MHTHLRTLLASVFLLSSVACSGGVNAGEQGGVAFIGLTIMLVAAVAIMWVIMGRDE